VTCEQPSDTPLSITSSEVQPIGDGFEREEQHNFALTLVRSYAYILKRSFLTQRETAMATKKATVPVSTRALIQRINRKLAADDMIIRTARSERARVDLGQYYVVNTRINGIVAPYKHLNLEDLGRELGVMAEWEHVVEE
jgi:hypothetical protein